jgi:hypothetical protein
LPPIEFGSCAKDEEVGLADGDVEHPVGAEHERATVVVPVQGREPDQQQVRRAVGDVAVGAETHEPVQAERRIREIDVDPRLFGEPGVDRHTEEAGLGGRIDIEVREGLREHGAVRHGDADVPGRLLVEEQP